MTDTPEAVSERAEAFASDTFHVNINGSETLAVRIATLILSEREAARAEEREVCAYRGRRHDSAFGSMRLWLALCRRLRHSGAEAMSDGTKAAMFVALIIVMWWVIIGASIRPEWFGLAP